MLGWTQVERFLQRELKESESKGDPLPLQAALLVLYQAFQAVMTLRKYLEDPENRGLRRCPWCKDEFRPLTEFVISCSDECDKKFKEYPPTMTPGEVENILAHVQLMEAQALAEKALL